MGITHFFFLSIDRHLEFQITANWEYTQSKLLIWKKGIKYIGHYLIAVKVTTPWAPIQFVTHVLTFSLYFVTRNAFDNKTMSENDHFCLGVITRKINRKYKIWYWYSMPFQPSGCKWIDHWIELRMTTKSIIINCPLVSCYLLCLISFNMASIRYIQTVVTYKIIPQVGDGII